MSTHLEYIPSYDDPYSGSLDSFDINVVEDDEQSFFVDEDNGNIIPNYGPHPYLDDDGNAISLDEFNKMFELPF